MELARPARLLFNSHEKNEGSSLNIYTWRNS